MGKIKSVKNFSSGGVRSAGSSSVSSTPSAPTFSSSSNDAHVGRTLLAPNTDIGQHFLKNPAVVDAIVTKSGIRPTDTVLEIGPGTGNLTVRILQEAKKVVAVEFDRRMVREVLKRVEGTENEKKISVIHGDVLKVDLPYFDLCIANLPYQISSPFLFKILAHRPLFRAAIVMFQLEFAQRLTAKPGDDLYCRLSVNCQLLAKVENLIKVGKANFRPPPKVDSLVVKIEIKIPQPQVDFEEWDGLIRILFNRKHKTLHAILTTKSTLQLLLANYKTHLSLENNGMEVETLELDGIKNIVEEVLNAEEMSTHRPFNLDGNQFLALLAAFNARKIHFR